jgi:hypothetical protein
LACQAKLVVHGGLLSQAESAIWLAWLASSRVRTWGLMMMMMMMMMHLFRPALST